MRVKNATFVQKHIEKLILLVAGLFLVIVLAIFVGGVINPYKVELGNSLYNQPSEVIPALLDDAEKINLGLKGPDPIDPNYVPPNMQTNYEQMMNQSVINTQQPTLPRRLSLRGTPLSDLNVIPPPPPAYVVPSPPMPTAVAADHSHAVLDTEFDTRLNSAYAELWGGQMRVPPDFYYVLLEGEFSMYDWVQALIGEPGEAGKIPSGIWKSRLNITAGYLIREEMDEATGQWLNRTIVRPLPGQIQLMPSENHSEDLDQAAKLIEEVGEQTNQQDITQPVLPALANDDFITLPKDGLFEDGEGIPGFEEDPFNDGGIGVPMNEAERQRAERRQAMEERRAEQEARRGGRGGPEDFEEGPGNSRNERDLERQRELQERRQRQLEEEERRRQALEQERIRREQERLRREEERRLANPGVDLGLTLPGGGTISAEQLTRVWAMDITAEYGKTYRYKLAVAVINPLYGVPRLDPEQYATNKNKAALGPSEEVIEAAEWSEPIVVPPKYEFFFVGGGENRSRIEVWTIYNGLRIRQEFEVSAGDPIGGEVIRLVPGMGEVAIDMTVGATVVDVERRLDISGRTVYALVYIDDQGRLHERLQSNDQSNPRRRELDLLQREQERDLAERLQFEQQLQDERTRPAPRR